MTNHIVSDRHPGPEFSESADTAPSSGDRRTGLAAAAWAGFAGLVALVFRAPSLSIGVAVGVAVAATALCCGAARLAGRSAVHWVGVLCCAAVIGAMAQIRLAESPLKVLVIASAAVVAFALTFFGVRQLHRLDMVWLVRPALVVIVGAFILRVLIPLAQDFPRSTNVFAGTVTLPGTGMSLQVGEFTRLALIVALGLIFWVCAEETRAARSLPVRSWQITAVCLSALGYLAVLAVFDNGPAVLTLVGVVSLAVLTFGAHVVWLAVRRRVLSQVGVCVLVVGAATVAVLGAVDSNITDRASGRFLSLIAPNEQMRAAFEAMQRGGVIGSGMGTSPFAVGVPVGDSDMLPAVLAADLGMAVMAGWGILVLGILASVSMASLSVPGYWGATGGVLVLVLLVQTAWTLLANVGIAPLSGISAPFLVITSSALVPAAMAVACALAAISMSARSEPRGKSLDRVRSWLTIGVQGLRTVASAALVISVALLMMFVPQISDAAQIRMPRGDIVTVDGRTVATTDDQGRRRYPHGNLYTEVGIVHPAGVHYAVESTMVDELTCGAPPSLTERLAVVLRPIPCTPAPVVATVDSRLQLAAESALNGASGSVAVLDAETGKIRALYSSDDVDPNEFRAQSLPPVPPTMAARQEQTELGSVFKIVTAAAGLLEHIDTRAAPTGTFAADGQTLENAGGVQCPSTTIIDMLAYSCNTVAAHIGVKVGMQQIEKVAETYFGSGPVAPFDASEVGFSGIHTGFGFQRPNAIEVARAAIGQEGVTGNALSMAVATAVVARSATGDPLEGGVPAPRLIEGYCRGGQFIDRPFEQTVGHLLPSDVGETVLLGMEQAVTRGTATRLDAPGRRLAAKTGTADTADPQHPVNSWVSVIVDHRWILTVLVHTDTELSTTAISVANQLLSRLPENISTPACPAN